MKPETHEFLRFPVGHFKDPKYDNGRCWQVTPHKTYCGQAPEYRCHVTTERTVNTDERLKQIRERQRNRKTSKWDSHGRSMLTDIDFLLSLVDSQAAGEYDTRVMNEIRERVTDGYESASSRNVTTVAALTLKDLHYVLSSHDGQCRRGATRMRAACVDVAEDYRQRIEYEDDEGVREAMFGDMVMKIEALTLDQVVEKPLTLEPVSKDDMNEGQV